MNRREAMKLTHPRAVMIQTTSRCNSACVICPHPQIRKTMPQGEMNDATFAGLIEEIAGYPDLKRVMLYLMNEPLMDPQIVPRIETARKALPDVELYIVSNGVALTDKLSDRLLDAGLTWIGFSLHANDADTYRKITGRKDFARVRGNVVRHVERMLDKHGPDSVMINITRVRPQVSDEQWDEAIDFWRSVGVQRLDLINGYISRAGNVEVYDHEPVKHAGVLGCRTVWAYEMVHVLFDGAVVPCCMDYRRQAVWGNVRDAGLLKVWQGDARREFLESMDGRELPDDFLCAHCEDAIPAPAKEKIVDDAPVEIKTDKTPDILLVHPPPWLTTGPPLGIAALSAWLQREGFDAAVRDVNIDLFHAVPEAQQRLWEWEEGQVWERERDVERLFGAKLRAIAAELAAHPAPVIGFGLASRKELAAALLAKEVARLAPEKLLIAGGPGTATRAERDRFFTLCDGAVKVFAVGEGEAVLAEILQAIAKGESPEGIAGVAFYREGQATFVEREKPVAIAKLPVPDYRDFDLARYGHPALAVEWSRGCTGSCAFCNVRQYWRRYRFKPASVVIAELSTLVERHDVEWLGLVDPVINGNPKELEKICDGIVERGLKLKWSAGISPNHELTEKQFAKMARAGCYRLEFGVESGSDRVLKSMKKRYTAARAIRMCRAAHAAGIDVVLYLIVGFPGESEDDFAATLDAVEQLAPFVKLVRSVNSLLLIPGAELCEDPDHWGLQPVDRTKAGWERRWQSDDLTADVRAERVDKLLAKLRALDVPVEFSNRDEVVNDSRRSAERIRELSERAAKIEQRLRTLDARAEKLLATQSRAEPEGAGQVALTICPVWGIDAPPYGLAALAAAAQAKGYRPLVRDFNVAVYHRVDDKLKRFWEEDSFRHWTDLADWRRLLPHLEETIEKIAGELLASGRQVIGFSVYSPNRRFTIEVCKHIKRSDPQRVIVVGGRGVHTAAERLLFPPDSVDYFVVGEGEDVLPELLAAIFAGSDGATIPGVVRFEGHHLTPLQVREYVDDISRWPAPTFAGFDLALYRSDELPILSTRGCTGHCTFCNDHPAMGPFRARPGRQVADEILGHVRRLNVRNFRFNDQLINGDLDALSSMCDALIDAGTDIEWIALAAPRGDMPDDLPRKMKRAGCYTLNIGIESGSDAVLKKMAKGYRVADIEKALAQIRAAGINTMVNFIVGFPGETEDDFAATLDFIRRNRDNICGVTSINTCIMLLGSPLENNKDKLGIVVPTGSEPDTGWVQGDNTPGLRAARAKRLLALLEELELPIRVSNLHEKAADVADLGTPPHQSLPTEQVLAPTSADPGKPDERKGLPRYEQLDAREVDVLLIMPPVWGTDVPPLGIAYIQSYLAAHGVSAQCLDLNVKLYNRAPDPDLWRMEAYKHWTEPELFAQTLDSLSDLIDHYAAQIAMHPAKVLGFSLNTGNFAFGRAFARRMKAANPERPIVLGGPGVTNSFDIATLSTDEADYLVLGEGEISSLALIRALLDGQTPDVDGVIKVGEPIDFDNLTRPIQEDLAVIDWPRLDDFNIAEYATDAVPILGSRGCIRRCTFCNDHHIYRKFRRRAPESVAEEMIWHAEQGRTRFTFHDVLINGDVKNLVRLSELLIASGHEVQWGGQGVIRKEMTLDVFRTMRAAGCQSFVFGVESFSNKILEGMNKPYTQETAHQVLKACHEAGVETIINIIVGFPGEGEKEFRETYDFVRDHGDFIDQVASISPCLINLGSRLFEKFEDYGIRFPPQEGSIKWFSDDGNNFEMRRRRVLALTTMLAHRDQSIHTVNLYDEKRGELPTVEIDDEPRAPDEDACAVAPNAERTDLVLALPPPWGIEFPPLGLATLTAVLRAEGFVVAPRDLNIEWYEACGDAMREYWELERLKFWAEDGRLDEIAAFLAPQIDAFIDEVAAAAPRAVGFSTNESNLPLAVRLGRRVKEKLPDTLLIFGGPGVHWPADRERIGGDAADLFVIGEGEATTVEILQTLREGETPHKIAGTAAWRDDHWEFGVERIPLNNLDALPVPDYTDLPLHLYRTNQMPLMAGRGCVNRCAFCNDHRMTPGYRALSPEKTLEHLVTLKRNYGAFAFSFNDLLINADLKRLRAFCKLVVESNERMAWTGQAVVRKDMTPGDYKLLKKAGCASLVFGVESFSDDVLKLMNKRFDAATAAKALASAKAAGIETLINLIVGFPGESEQAFAATCDFLREHGDLIDRVSAASTCIVVAQCALEKDPEQFGIVLPKPEHWCQWHSKDGDNTYAVRVERLHKLIDLLDELGIDHGMTNLYREALEGVS